MAVFAVLCLAASPLLFFQWGIDWLGDRVVARWPGNARAEAVRFWLRLLAPIVLIAVLLVVLGFAIARVRTLAVRRAHGEVP